MKRGGVEMAVLGADDGGAGRGKLSPYETEQRAAIGMRTLVTLIFTAAVITIIYWYSQSSGIEPGAPEASDAERQISRVVGLSVSAGLALFLVGTAFGPGIAERMKSVGNVLMLIGSIAWPLAVPFIWADAILRRVVGAVSGVGFRSWWYRYPILSLHIGLASLFMLAHYGLFLPFASEIPAETWWAPSLRWLIDPPLWAVIAALCWAFIVLLGVVRSWFWNEEQFDLAVAGMANVDPESLADLRDEALVAILLFFAAIPVALSLFFNADPDAGTQNYFVFTGECIRIGDNICRPPILEWYAFFGAELLKALPFVDWAEVYGIESNTDIQVAAGSGRNVVFVTRVVVDLVLLTTLLHSIERVGRISRQDREFRAGLRDVVDPYLEQKYVSAIVRGWRWRDDADLIVTIQNFENYDDGRLKRLAEHTRDDIRALAYHLLVHPQRIAKHHPEYLADRIAGTGGVSRETDAELRELLIRLLTRSNGNALRALQQTAENPHLNWRMRNRAIVAIVKFGAQHSQSLLERIAVKDSKGDNRIEAMKGLATLDDPSVAEFLQRCSVEDNANFVRNAAKQLLEQRLQPNPNPT